MSKDDEKRPPVTLESIVDVVDKITAHNKRLMRENTKLKKKLADARYDVSSGMLDYIFASIEVLSLQQKVKALSNE